MMMDGTSHSGAAHTARTTPRLAIAGALLVATLLLLVGAAPAQADVLVSNLYVATGGNSPAVPRDYAQGFTTGNNEGYALTSIEFSQATAGVLDSTLTVTVAATSPSSTVLQTLTRSGSIGWEYEVPSGDTLILNGETQYFVIVIYSGSGTDPIPTWESTTTNSEDSGYDGWSIADTLFARSHQPNANWSVGEAELKIGVHGSALPMASDQTVTTNEDTEHTFAAGDFNFSDADTGDALESVKITTLPGTGEGALKFNNSTISDNDLPKEVTKDELAADKLKYKPPANAYGAAITTFEFKVNDGTFDSQSASTMTIDVTAVNDAPTSTNDSITTKEDKTYTIKEEDFGYADVEGDALVHVRIVTRPTNLTGTETRGQLRFDGAHLTSFPKDVTPADLAANKLKYKPPGNKNGEPYAFFRFQLYDGTAYSGEYWMNVDVTPVNDLPTSSNRCCTNAVNLNEDEVYTFVTGDFPFTDIDDDALDHVSILSPPRHPDPAILELRGTLKLDGVTLAGEDLPSDVPAADLAAGKFEYHPPENESGAPHARIIFTVNDGTADSEFGYQMYFDIAAVNDAPVVSGDAAIEYAENDTIDVATYSATDQEGDSLTWGLAGDDSGAFSLSNELVLSFNSSPNFETPTDVDGDNVYEVTVEADDGTNTPTATGSLAVTVTVTDEPVVTGTAQRNYAENGTDAVATYQVSGSSNVTWSLSGPDSGDFSITGGELTFNDSPNYEAPTDGDPADTNNLPDNVYEVTVEADDGVETGRLDVTVTVTDANDPPVLAGSTELSIAETDQVFRLDDCAVEDDTCPAYVGTFTASDDEANDIVYAYLLSPGGASDKQNDSPKFAVRLSGTNYTTIRLFFLETPNFESPEDGDEDNVYEIEFVSLNVGHPQFNTLDVSITVTDENDAPVAGADEATTEEDTAETIPVLANDTDEDAGNVLSVSQVGEEIAPSSGTVAITAGSTTSVTYTPEANFHGTDSFTYTVSDIDSNDAATALTATGTVYVTVTAVNDVPTSADVTRVTDEDTEYTFVAGNLPDFAYGDIDGDQLDHVKITELPATGTGKLFLDDVRITNTGKKVSKTKLANGSFTYTPPANANGDGDGTGFATFQFKVNDGTNDSGSAYTFTMNVTAVNDAPTASDNTVDTNQYLAYPFTAADFGFADVDGDTLDHVKITALPGTETGKLFLGDEDAVEITSVAPPPQVTPAQLDDGELTYTPPPGLTSDLYATVKFKVNDGTVDSGEHTITVHVDKVDTPVVSGPAALDYEEGGTQAVAAYQATSPDGANIVWSLDADSADAGDFTISSTGVLSFASAPDFGSPADADGDNVYEVTVQAAAVIDGYTVTGTLAVTVTVTGANAPALAGPTAIDYQDGDTSAVAAYTVTNRAAADLTWSLAGTDAGDFAISDGGVLTFASAPDFEDPADDDENNEYLVTVTASDGSRTGTLEVTVTVIEVPDADDPPALSGPTTIYYGENGTHDVGIFTVVNPPADAITSWSLTGTDAGDFSISSAGVLRFASAPDFENPTDNGNDNEYQVTVNASHDSDTVTLNVTVTVTDVNELPRLSGPTTIFFGENGTQGVGAFSVVNRPAAAITWSLTGADAADFGINSAGTLSFASPPNYEDPADAGLNNVYEVTVEASDGSDTVTLDVTVTVVDVNEPPTSANQGVSTEEDTAYPFTAPDFTFVDVDANDALDQVKITALPATGTGTLSLDGAQITGANLPKPVSQDELAAGKLTYMPPADLNGSPFTTFRFKINDGAADSTAQYTMSIGVTPVNDAPTAPDSTVVRTTQYRDYTFTAANFGFLDVDSGDTLDHVTITLIRGAIGTTNAGEVQLNGNSITDGTQVTKGQLDDGKLKYIRPADPIESFYLQFDYLVHDGDSYSSEESRMSVFLDFLYTPAVSGPKEINYPAGSTAVVGTYTATTEEFESITLHLQDSDDHDDFEFNSTTGELTFKTPPNFENPTDGDPTDPNNAPDNVYKVTVAATVEVDGDSETGTLDVSVTVTEANATLTVSGPTAISYGENDTHAVAAFTASNPGGATVTWGLADSVDSVDSAAFNISEEGVLSFGSVPDYELPADADEDNDYHVTVTAGAGADETSTLNVTVTVTEADDLPKWSGVNAFSVAEGYPAYESFATFKLTDQDTKLNGVRQDISTYFIVDDEPADRRLIFLMVPWGPVDEDVDEVTISFRDTPDYEMPADKDRDNTYELILIAYNPGINNVRVAHQVTVNVTNIDEDPVATRDSVTTDEDVTIEIPVLDNDLVDQTAKPLSVVAVTAAATDGSSAVLDSESNTITYTPSPNFHGADSFSYTITDNATPARTDTATVRVRVLPVNDPPVAVADPDFAWAKTSENTALDVPAERPLDNDWDPEGDHLTVTEVGIPEIPLNGAAVWDPMTQTITYTPRPNYHGSDTFSYTVSDGNDTADSTVTVTIRQDSADANLAALAIVTGALSPLTLTPSFEAGTTSYEVDGVVPYTVEKVRVRPTTNDTAATVTVNGMEVESGSRSKNIELTEGGATLIEVEVTAEDGTTKTYTITVFHPPNDAALYFEEKIGSEYRWITRTLDNQYCLNPDQGEQGCLPSDLEFLRFTATAQSDKVRIRRPGKPDSDAYYSLEIISAQDAADGTITNRTTAKTDSVEGTSFRDESDLITVQQGVVNNIWVTVTVGSSHSVTAITSCYDASAVLANLVVAGDSGTVPLSAEFASDVTAYSAAVEYAVDRVTVTPTGEPAGACTTITVAGTEVASGATSGAIELTEGEVTSIPVVFANGSDQTTYTIQVFRPAAIAVGGSGSSLGEGDASDDRFHSFPVTLSAAILEGFIAEDAQVDVNWSVASGPGSNRATADDFPNGVFPSGSVTFSSGDDLTKFIQIRHRDDTVVENDERFLVTLTPPAGGFPAARGINSDWASLNRAGTNAEGTIMDDDRLEGNFRFGASIDSPTYLKDVQIEPLVLPAAAGASGTVSYELEGALPAGLQFDAATRTIAGTPTQLQAERLYKWTATDQAEAEAQLTFSIAVEPYLGVKVVGSLPPLTLYVGGESAQVDAAPVMIGDDLSWTFASSDAGVATVQGAGSVVEVAPVHEGTAQVTATATNQHGTASVAFTVTVRTSAAEAEAIRAALAGHARVVLGSVTDVIGQRVDGGTGGRGSGCAPTDDAGNDGTWNADPRGGSGTYASGFDGSLGDPSGAGGVETGGIRHVGNSGRGGGMIGGLDDALSLIWGRSFSLALGGDQATDCAGMGGNASRWNVWGAADLQQASGGTEVSDYEGEWRLLYFGADRAFDEQLMGGMAVSRVWGEADYRFEDHTASGAGHLSSTLTGIYPYVYGSFWGLQLWAIGGLGSGDVTNVREHVPGPPDEGNLVMGLAVAGLSKSLYELGGVQLSLIGDVGYLSLSADGGGSLAGAQASVGRVRLGLEMAGRLAFGLEPFVQVRGRYDGGDGPTGTAAEMVGGLRYTAERLNLEVRGNYLVSTADFQQWGANARVGYRPAADGGGLSGSLATQWGAPDSGGSFQDGHTMQMPGADLGSAGQSPPLNLSGEIGYGLSIPRLRGSLTPTVGYDYRGQGDSRASVGVAYVQSGNLAGDVRLRLDIARTERRESPPDHSLEASVELRY